MRVKVRIMAPLYFGLDSVDQIRLELELPEGSTVEDVIDKIDSLYKGFKNKIIKNNKIIDMHDILVNGRSIDFLEGLKTKIKDNDLIIIVSPFGG
ncbi:MoaD/ThiS family protein [Thermoproteus tenax]|uniref:Molybdopterin converting factor, small subunit n=1 Tax=Thermoproteus tenax (strain ATCC 35583 / DSM 2078 / JCM 9277 / NBRC 100435 / Kra 1) TaxID=768679 RepID=G4RLE4_THETK|nr:MoaD/ThiS family protein [Thermoproteus tenax]CCC82389.1 molybdopterin converting factor, small subunit [Thermoproteus tenax Kra 1]